MTRGTALGSIVLVLVLEAASGCARGPLPGRLIQSGQGPEAVTLNYESSVLGGSGKLWTVLPDEGNRGGSMLCRFRLNEPGVGPHGGGAGTCQLSQGGTIELTF
jgi:hypothetical protein